MNDKDFDENLEYRISLMRKMLKSKGKEYSIGGDRLSNFKRASKILQCSPEKALIGMWIKHAVSLLDMMDELELKCGTNLGVFPAFKVEEYMGTAEEKIGDMINYLAILEIIIRERAKPFREYKHD